MKIIKITVILYILILTGCTYSTQTTSGQDYITKYPTQPTYENTDDMNQAVLDVANVEPLLRFPARIGLVRIFNGQLTNIPPQEFTAWYDATKRLGKQFGEFVPVSPIIADMVSQPTEYYHQSGRDLIRKIRLGAARQHLDVVLIYELFSETKTAPLATAVANWTIIGMYIIPSEKTTTIGHANALLLDVRNGYPYGTASSTAEETDVFTFSGVRKKAANLAEQNRTVTALKLIPEVEKMLFQLKDELKAH